MMSKPKLMDMNVHGRRDSSKQVDDAKYDKNQKMRLFVETRMTSTPLQGPKSWWWFANSHARLGNERQGKF